MARREATEVAKRTCELFPDAVVAESAREMARSESAQEAEKAAGACAAALCRPRQPWRTLARPGSGSSSVDLQQGQAMQHAAVVLGSEDRSEGKRDGTEYVLRTRAGAGQEQQPGDLEVGNVCEAAQQRTFLFFPRNSSSCPTKKVIAMVAAGQPT